MKKVLIIALLLLGLAVLLLSNGTPGQQDTANERPTDNIQPVVLTKITSNEFSSKIASDNTLVILDIRTPQEYTEGHLTGAVNMDFYAADFAVELARLDKNATYLMYCRSGNRSASALEQMRQLGFRSVYELSGGINAWKSAGQPVCAGC